MSERKLKDILVERSVELFYHTDEPVYAVNEDWPNAYPIRYSPYDLGAAALEALVEANVLDLSTQNRQVIRMVAEVRQEAVKQIPDESEITRARTAAAFLLNNYGGRDRVFSPN